MRSEILLPHCHYRHLENGLHEFVFLSNSRLAVDDYFSILESHQLSQGEGSQEVLRLLIELRQPGMPPVSYMMQRYRDFVKANKDRMPATRVVYLYRSGFMLSMVRAFIGLISERKHTNRRFLPITEREQAETWLLEVPAAQK
jgi:hypothetical protein